MTLPTNKGNMTPGEILNHLEYGSYAANRDYGMTHEQLRSIGIGNYEMKQKYEASKIEKPASRREAHNPDNYKY